MYVQFIGYSDSVSTTVATLLTLHGNIIIIHVVHKYTYIIITNQNLTCTRQEM